MSATARAGPAGTDDGPEAGVKLVVLQRGKVRDRQVILLREEYLKRFQRFGSLRLVEDAKEAPVQWPASSRWRILLDERGAQLGSVELARSLERWAMQHGEIACAVGGAGGHHASTVAGATYTLSLGLMTLPHQLAQLILIEQLYRSATIINRLPYHHGDAS